MRERQRETDNRKKAKTRKDDESTVEDKKDASNQANVNCDDCLNMSTSFL